MSPRVILWGKAPHLRVEGMDVEQVTSWSGVQDALSQPAQLVAIMADAIKGERLANVIASIRRIAPGTAPRVVWVTSSEEVLQVNESRDALHDVCTQPLTQDLLDNWLSVPEARSSSTRALRSMFTQGYRQKDFVVQSKAMRDVLDLVGRAARSKATVLIQGESGTGKEKVARFVHDQSPRAAHTFLAVNCKAFSTSVLESELFGHWRGAFTGATYRKQGVFERAHGGTLFLDEIGEVDLDFQAKLLRVLQEQEVLPVGAPEPIKVDVRVVVATNRNLNEEVERGRFRQDLLYRLSVIPVLVPPLRERRDEILPLAQHFLTRYGHALGRALEGWSEDVARELCEYHWPGNVRELENVIERACVLAQGSQLEVIDLMRHTFATDGGAERATGETLQEVVDAATRAHLERVLDRTQGRRQEAAQVLGVERTTLYRLLKRYDLEARHVST